jgi:hypothetical protein
MFVPPLRLSYYCAVNGRNLTVRVSHLVCLSRDKKKAFARRKPLSLEGVRLGVGGFRPQSHALAGSACLCENTG